MDINKSQELSKGAIRIFAVFVLLMSPLTMLWAQNVCEKYSLSTQLFLDELKGKAKTHEVTPRRFSKLQPSDRVLKLKSRRIIASPDTIGGTAYISCFIHLKDVSNLNGLRSLGVEVEETFDGLDFITARVPVDKLEQVAATDNVTLIKVAECKRPSTDVARQATNTDDLLCQTNDATMQGIKSKYDGTGVVLGIIDWGIDFQHIAFKDKNGNSRIKRAYVYNGSTGKEYTTVTSSSPTTDDNTEDHGTHTSSTAGGSSVIVNGSTVSVTNDHANATYGGMAPGCDLYLAGLKGLNDTYIANALKKMVEYADAQGKPLVVSNSWGTGDMLGPHDGTGEWADLVGQYFGDNHPGRIILHSAGNNGGNIAKDNEGGGHFVKKVNASSSNPLGTIMRSVYYTYADAGCYYRGTIATAWSAKPLSCKLYVLNSSTGEIKKSWNVSSSTSSFSSLSTYYSGGMRIDIRSYNGKYYLKVSTDDQGMETESVTTTTKNGKTYYKSDYTLAIQVFPASGSADVNMWSGEICYFTNHLNTTGCSWTAGTADMCVNDETTIPNVISVGAYVSKTIVTNYQGDNYQYNSGTQGDIASFSSYATATQSPTGLDYPWITAPGAQIVAGVNHYHTKSVDDESYFGNDGISKLVVNNSSNPYGVMAGTSMSTPVAAGIVALWLQAAQSVNKSLTVNDVKEIMEQTAIHDSYTSGTNATHFGKGKIDALAGIKYILQYAEPEPTSYPELNFVSVSCKNSNPSQLKTTDALNLSATFKNVGESGNVQTVPVIMTKDDNLDLVKVGDIRTDYFASSQNTTVNYSLPLSDVQPGNYYATVLFYQDSDDEEENGWYYSSKYLVDITVVNGGGGGDMVNNDNVIYPNNAEGLTGTQAVISFSMKNTANIRGFQFELVLPDGVTAAKDSKGRIMAKLTDGRRDSYDEHTLAVSVQPDGSLLFLCGSLYNETFQGNDGEVATLTVDIDENMAEGDYPIILRNIKLTESDISKFYETSEMRGIISIKSIMLGDINSDGLVDVSDYIGIANRILGKAPAGFIEKAGDVDKNGVIDVSDYIGVANIILTGSIYGKNNRSIIHVPSLEYIKSMK